MRDNSVYFWHLTRSHRKLCSSLGDAYATLILVHHQSLISCNHQTKKPLSFQGITQKILINNFPFFSNWLFFLSLILVDPIFKVKCTINFQEDYDIIIVEHLKLCNWLWLHIYNCWTNQTVWCEFLELKSNRIQYPLSLSLSHRLFLFSSLS